MPASSLVAVLVAALLHASWNLVLKSSTGRLAAASIQVALAGLALVPILVWRGFPTEVLRFLVGSAIVEVGYIFALATAYHRADRVSGLGWAALALICSGVLMIGLSAATRRGVPWSLITGFLIAAYITIDGAGVLRAPDTLAYTASLYIMTAALLIPAALIDRGRAVVSSALRADWKRQFGAEVASLGSYTLLLYASRSTPLALVSAARESGILFATVLG